MDDVKLIIVIALWCSALICLARLRSRRSTAPQWFAATVVFYALGFTIDYTPIFAWLSSLVGSVAPHASQHFMVLVSATCLATFAARATGARGTRIRFLGLGATIAGLIASAAWVAAAMPSLPERPLMPFFSTYPSVFVYMTIYTTWLGTMLATVIWLSASYARRTNLTRLRLGLAAVILGCGVGVAYSGNRLFQNVYILAGGQLTTDRFSEILASSWMAASVCGFVIFPTALLGKQLARTVTHVRLYRRIKPMWHDVQAAVPSVVLPLVGVLRWRPEILLSRAVIEIRDAQLLLRPWLPAHEATPQAEAAAIATAIANSRSNSPTPAAKSGISVVSSSRDLSDEAARLASVAAYFTPSTAT